MTIGYFVQLNHQWGVNPVWGDIEDITDPSLNNPRHGLSNPAAAFGLLDRRAAHAKVDPAQYRVVQRETEIREEVVERPAIDPGTLGAHVTDTDGDLWARGNGDAWMCLSEARAADNELVSYSWAKLVGLHGPVEVQP